MQLTNSDMLGQKLHFPTTYRISWIYTNTLFIIRTVIFGIAMIDRNFPDYYHIMMFLTN